MADLVCSELVRCLKHDLNSAFHSQDSWTPLIVCRERDGFRNEVGSVTQLVVLRMWQGALNAHPSRHRTSRGEMAGCVGVSCNWPTELQFEIQNGVTSLTLGVCIDVVPALR